MDIKPILFSTSMVKSIQSGDKSQTRRMIDKTERTLNQEGVRFAGFTDKGIIAHFRYKKNGTTFCGYNPKYLKGDILWVRETWHPTYNENDPYFYKADLREKWDGHIKWKPSIFMPKEACRIFLKVTNVRVERLQDISEEDAVAEGISRYPKSPIYGFKDYTNNTTFRVCPKESFFTLWESINGREFLDLNPWVWVYDFEITERPDDFLPLQK